MADMEVCNMRMAWQQYGVSVVHGKDVDVLRELGGANMSTEM